MKALIDCTRMTAQVQYTEACYTALLKFKRDADMNKTYWTNQVVATGGIDDLNNGVQKGQL